MNSKLYISLVVVALTTTCSMLSGQVTVQKKLDLAHEVGGFIDVARAGDGGVFIGAKENGTYYMHKYDSALLPVWGYQDIRPFNGKSDGGLMMAEAQGVHSMGDSVDCHLQLVTTDDMGAILGSRTSIFSMGENVQTQRSSRPVQNSQGDMFVAVSTSPSGTGQKTYVIKTDAIGDPYWVYSIDMWPNAMVIEDGSGGCFVMSNDDSYQFIKYGHLDSMGQVIYLNKLNYPGIYNCYVESAETTNGELIMYVNNYASVSYLVIGTSGAVSECHMYAPDPAPPINQAWGIGAAGSLANGDRMFYGIYGGVNEGRTIVFTTQINGDIISARSFTKRIVGDWLYGYDWDFGESIMGDDGLVVFGLFYQKNNIFSFRIDHPFLWRIGADLNDLCDASGQAMAHITIPNSQFAVQALPLGVTVPFTSMPSTYTATPVTPNASSDYCTFMNARDKDPGGPQLFAASVDPGGSGSIVIQCHSDLDVQVVDSYGRTLNGSASAREGERILVLTRSSNGLLLVVGRSRDGQTQVERIVIAQ